MTDPVTDPADPPPAAGQGRTLLVGGGVAVVVLLGLVAVLALGGGGGGTTPAADGSPSPQAEFGLTNAVAELPPATLDGFAGGPDLVIADLLGNEPLVINFWATWCPPCVEEMPDLQALHEEGEGVLRVVGIDVRDAPRLAEDFIEEVGTTYDLAIDPDETYFTATGGFGMPTTLFVRPDGSVAYRQTGPMTLQTMRDLVAEHLGVDLGP